MGPFERTIEEHGDPALVNSSRAFPRIYVRYIAETQGVSLAEAASRSMSRMWGLFTDLNANVGIITAFRNEYSLEKNHTRNRALESDLRSLRLGLVPVIGGYPEKDQVGEFREEESFVVSEHSPDRESPEAMAQRSKRFASGLLKLVQKYSQDSVLLKLAGSNKVIVLNNDGSQFSPGTWTSINQAAEFYTYLHGGGQKGVKFAFECAGDYTVSTRRAVYEWLRSKQA